MEMNQLVGTLVEDGTLRSQNIIDAFNACDRKQFVPEEQQSHAYQDVPLPIGYDQTISQPTTVAFMLELLGARPGERVLDIGSGSGWTTALLSHIVGSQGFVMGLERVPELVAFGNKNLSKHGVAHARIEQAGVTLGAPKEEPFDRILVSAAARTFPHEILAQVKEQGVIVLPVRNAIWRVVRVEHQPIIEKFDGYVFVPLITEEDQYMRG